MNLQVGTVNGYNKNFLWTLIVGVTSFYYNRMY